MPSEGWLPSRSSLTIQAREGWRPLCRLVGTKLFRGFDESKSFVARATAFRLSADPNIRQLEPHRRVSPATRRIKTGGLTVHVAAAKFARRTALSIVSRRCDRRAPRFRSPAEH